MLGGINYAQPANKGPGIMFAYYYSHNHAVYIGICTLKHMLSLVVDYTECYIHAG